MLYFPAPFYWLHGGPFEFTAYMQATVANSGVHMRGGALIPMLRAVSSSGILVFIVLCSAIPAVVALVLAPLTFGKRGFSTLLCRFRPWSKDIPASKGLQTWCLVVVTLVATQLFAFLLLHAFRTKPTETITWNKNLLSWAAIWLVLEAMFTNQGGLLEELGWRGYGLPLLLEKMNPLRATLLLGFLWALWHLPRDFAFHFPKQYGLTEYLVVYLPMFFSWCIGGSILMTYFFNRTGGSALVAIAIHGLLNDSAGLSGKMLGGDLLHSMLPRTLAVVAAGILTVILAGPKLGLKTSVGISAADGIGKI
jgi:membrane protease YdiL (CAAX protease family)